jgi:hypothetical protein
VCVFSCKTARNSFYGCDRTIDSVARAKARGKGTKKTEKTNEPAGEANYLFLRASSIKRAINGGI